MYLYLYINMDMNPAIERFRMHKSLGKSEHIKITNQVESW